jgi:hypothetical protein
VKESAAECQPGFLKRAPLLLRNRAEDPDESQSAAPSRLARFRPSLERPP